MSNTEDLENIFAYGTLQREAVQLALFGRHLIGQPDTLIGYCQTKVAITDEEVTAISTDRYYLNIQYTADGADLIEGMVYQISKGELNQVDIYEAPANYHRVNVQLKSGTRAWVYLNLVADKKD